MSASSRDLSIPDGLILFLPAVRVAVSLYCGGDPPDQCRTGAGAGAFRLCPAGDCLYRVRPFPGGGAAALLLVLFPEGTGEQSALSGAILPGPEFCFHSGHDAAGAQSLVPRCPGRGAVRLPAATAHCPGAARSTDDRHIRPESAAWRAAAWAVAVRDLRAGPGFYGFAVSSLYILQKYGCFWTVFSQNQNILQKRFIYIAEYDMISPTHLTPSGEAAWIFYARGLILWRKRSARYWWQTAVRSRSASSVPVLTPVCAQ